jgi:adenylylsulfate kinase-like enzyme
MDKGLTLWFTGLSGSGKSTLAQYLTPKLIELGKKVEILDGDEVRENLSKGLGFSKEDRDTNIRRIGFVANMLARNGVVAITAAISPYREIRNAARSTCSRSATRRGSTRRRAPGSSRTSRASAIPMRSPRAPR